MVNITPVILCGGSGTRLWPKSRKMLPKQLLRLTGEQTMLQQTLLRVRDYGKPVIVCNEDHRFMVAQQAQEVGFDEITVITEPVGRNTAAAIAFAAFSVVRKGEDTNLLVLPSDQLLEDIDQFHRAVDIGLQKSTEGGFVTFGIVPTAPETGYGYIKKSDDNGANIHKIAEFVEKPDLNTAKTYIANKSYYWNSGMFLFGARSMLDELKSHAPSISKASEDVMNAAVVESDFIKLRHEYVSVVPENSIDYAVMEKTQNGFVVPLDCSWSDVGSWSSLWEVLDKDKQGNATVGDVILEDCKDSLVFGEDNLVAAVGVEDLIIVDTKDATLVAPKNRCQEVRAVVSKIKSARRNEHEIHREVVRPWGKYDSIGSGSRFQVKKITVNPGASLSLQMHHHRAEHWVVVSGTAMVELEGEEMMLPENESIYIPIGAKHRLKNPGILPIELIEVQSGSYLGEDDIVRFDDAYGRTTLG